jgi:hypothetical protein
MGMPEHGGSRFPVLYSPFVLKFMFGSRALRTPNLEQRTGTPNRT